MGKIKNRIENIIKVNVIFFTYIYIYIILVILLVLKVNECQLVQKFVVKFHRISTIGLNQDEDLD